MKTRKKLKLLQGITAIRVKAGITQLALAQYLGISKSLVSMVENNRRSLPLAALLKLSELEQQFQQGSETPFRLPVYQESTVEAATRSLKETVKRSHLAQLQYRLHKMELLREETLASLQYLHRMQPATAGLPFTIFEREKQKLLKRLKRCDEMACATIKGKMAMLEMVLESYGREDGTKLTTQFPANKPGVAGGQQAAHAALREMSVGNPSQAVKFLRERQFLRVQLTA